MSLNYFFAVGREVGLPLPPPRRPVLHRVQGEILRDGSGRLYERIGRYARPLRPPQQPQCDEAVAGGRPESGGEAIHAAPPIGEDGSFRRLFADPGWSLMVRFGEFKDLLAPQMARPEHLREWQPLPCLLQIYEARKPVRLETLAAAILGRRGVAGQVSRLTRDVAERLGLMPVQIEASTEVTGVPRDSNLLLPGERAFRLQAAADPTGRLGPDRTTVGGA